MGLVHYLYREPQHDSWSLFSSSVEKSEQWTHHYPDYAALDPREQAELKYAMEEASGPVLLRNWIEVRTLVLQWFKEQLTFLGACGAIFSRDEYQKESGNLFHEHLVFAIKRSSLSTEADQFILDSLRASVLEVIQTDEIEALIDQGLLSSQSDYFEKIK